MLTRLVIEQIAIIESLELQFRPGLNVITGETGSGKSLLLDAIEWALGKRLSPKDALKEGSQRGRIELTVDTRHLQPSRATVLLKNLQKAGVELFEGEYEIVFSREITPSSSRCRINGVLVAMEVVESIGQWILEMVGQHSLHQLFSAPHQRTMLDHMGGEPLLSVKKQLRASFRQWQQLKQQIEQLEQQGTDREKQLDWIQFQIQEIAEADIHDLHEDQQLKIERERLNNKEQLLKTAMGMQQLMSGDAAPEQASLGQLLTQLTRSLGQFRSIEPQFDMWYQEVTDCAERLREFGQYIERYVHHMDVHPERLQEIVDRLDQLEKLKRKYGGSLESVIKTAATLEVQLEQLQQSDENLVVLQTDCKQRHHHTLELAKVLTELRQSVACHLEQNLQNELESMMLPYARFHVGFQSTELMENGQDQVDFLFSANPGESLKKLAAVASGGELARFLLALKMLTAHSDGSSTLILDEADTGMSGVTLRTIAEKLQVLSQQVQLIVVTHQPIMAACAEWHVHLSKAVSHQGVLVQVDYLEEAQQRAAVLGQLAVGTPELDGGTQQFAEGLLATSSRQTLL